LNDKFADLIDEGVKTLSAKLLEDQYPLGKKNDFINDPVLDHLFFHIFCDILVSKTAYSEMVSEFIKADTEVQNAFDKQLRSRVYDALYDAHGGLR
jgi:hypothetical protein